MSKKWRDIRRKHSPEVKTRIRKEVEEVGKVIAPSQRKERERDNAERTDRPQNGSAPSE